MAYLINSSSLIEAKARNFCFDICPGFWAWLERHNRAGHIFSIDRVFDELVRGNDALSPWAKQQGTRFFLPTDAKAIAAITRINQWVVGADFKPQVQSEFLRGADPFLIAFALAHGHTVVTDEILVVGEKKRIKIPLVCQVFNVACITPHEMLRR